MSKGDQDAFLKALFIRETSGDSKVINYAGYIGKYQFGEAALIDLGYYTADGTNKNDWTGTWTGKNGINSRDEFLASVAPQDQAAKEWVALLCKRMRKLGLDAYIGKTINGIKITDSGIIAGAHLKGFGNDKRPGVKHFLKSDGEIDGKDGLGTAVSHYVELFGDYDVGCCKKVTLTFAEKETKAPIAGMKVKVLKNGKDHKAVQTDADGYIESLLGFNPGDQIDILVEKVAGGYKTLKSMKLPDIDMNLIFLSPKAKAVVPTQPHKPAAKPAPKPAAKAPAKPAPKPAPKPAAKPAPKLDNLDKVEAIAPKKATAAPPPPTAMQGKSSKGHPKATVKKPPPAPPPSQVRPMQKTITGLLFPLEKRPTQSYKEGARQFGSNRSKGKRKHGGIDLYAPVGTPVRAMADGKVILTYAFYDGTYVIEVDHGTYMVRYGEVKKKMLVSPGDEIKRGQQLGEVGKLLSLNYSMLHLEMYATNESPKLKPLTQRGNNIFQRRDDLIDPTPSIDAAVME